MRASLPSCGARAGGFEAGCPGTLAKVYVYDNSFWRRGTLNWLDIPSAAHDSKAEVKLPFRFKLPKGGARHELDSSICGDPDASTLGEGASPQEFDSDEAGSIESLSLEEELAKLLGEASQDEGHIDSASDRAEEDSILAESMLPAVDPSMLGPDAELVASAVDKNSPENPLWNEGELLESSIGGVAASACDVADDAEEDSSSSASVTSGDHSEESDEEGSSSEGSRGVKVPPLGPPMVFNDVPCVAGCGQVMGQLKHVPGIGARKEKLLVRTRRADGSYDAMGSSNRSRHVSCHGGDVGACPLCQIMSAFACQSCHLLREPA